MRVEYVRGVEVKGIRWLGVSTERVALMRSFAIDVLGLKLGGEDTEDFVVLVTADGSRFELFGPNSASASPELFEASPVVAGFLVDDIAAARGELGRTPNVELLGEIQSLPDGYSWQHFRAPDGNVYELTFDPNAAG